MTGMKEMSVGAVEERGSIVDANLNVNSVNLLITSLIIVCNNLT
jgi:hypothetical protein